MTVGQGDYGDVLRLGFFRLGQLLCTVLANIRVDQGLLCLETRYYQLEKSEKDAVSYLLGMAVAKVIGEALLRIPWLRHVSRSPGVTLTHGSKPAKSKVLLHRQTRSARAPDLIGLDQNGEAHVVEAKGSCSGFNGGSLQHAIDQVSQVTLVNGRPPATRVACFADCSTSGIRATAVDPDRPETGVALDFDPDSMIGEYYRPFLHSYWTEASSERLGGFDYRVRPIGVPDLYLGVREDVLEAVRRPASFERLRSLTATNEAGFERGDREISASADGTILFGVLP